jgi:predicted O-methyltransferase YrrM
MLPWLVRRLPPKRHPDTWVELDALRTVRPYRRTFRFVGRYISPFQRALAYAPTDCMGIKGLINLGIPGYLHPEEAMKLYELAYFNAGDVLELGTFHGLSTSIIAHALHDRAGGSLVTVDSVPEHSAAAAANIREGRERVDLLTGDANIWMDALIAQGRRFGFIFVDHWHSYEATVQAVERSLLLLSQGGFVAFHDYTARANATDDQGNKVYQAVRAAVVPSPHFRFMQVCCSMGVFQRVTSAP